MSTSQTARRDDRSAARSNDLAAEVVAPDRAYDLSVIIPTRNEAGNIGPLLARLGDALTPIFAAGSHPLAWLMGAHGWDGRS
jgi:hypothetical protein